MNVFESCLLGFTGILVLCATESLNGLDSFISVITLMLKFASDLCKDILAQKCVFVFVHAGDGVYA